MTEAQTYSWIFYAIGLASQKKDASYAEVVSLADGINHAVPTKKELEASIAWLVAHQFVSKEGKLVRLTQDGCSLLIKARESNSTSIGVWKYIKMHFEQVGSDDSNELNPRTMTIETF
jgi:hypothetical protein